MKKLGHTFLKVQVWKDIRGQDLIEYALMTGFLAVAVGLIVPGLSANISQIFSNVISACGLTAKSALVPTGE